MVYKVENSWSFTADTTFDVEMLSDYIFPSIYVKQIDMSEEPNDVETLQYPTIVDYDHAFGTNPVVQMDARKVSDPLPSLQ
jgi:hypothetical protein